MKNFRLTGVFWHEGELVVSKCPELGVASCGETVEEAMANLRGLTKACIRLPKERRRLMPESLG